MDGSTGSSYFFFLTVAIRDKIGVYKSSVLQIRLALTALYRVSLHEHFVLFSV